MKRPTKHSLIGKWRIIEMELWDKDFLDMMEPVYIAFDGKAARHRHRFCNRRSSVCPLFLSLPLYRRRGLRRRFCHQDHWRRQSREDRERFRYPIQGHVACHLPYLPSTKYNAS
jgi:hypothetical protein